MSSRRFQERRLSGAGQPDLVAELIEAGPDVTLVVDPAGKIQQSFGPVRNLGRNQHELAGRTVQELVSEESLLRVEQLLARTTREPDLPATEEVRLRARESPWRMVELVARNELANPKVGGLVLSVRDISARKNLEERLRSDAMHDPMTKLPNRKLFADRLSLALERQRRRRGCVAVLFLDVDDFKSVNDRLGHEAGDELIVAIAGRIDSLLRAVDTAARLGGDEFAILLEDTEEAAAVNVARRIVNVFRAPFSLPGELTSVSISIGIAASANPATTGSELLRRADMAMYAAKMSGGLGFEVFRDRTERLLRGAEETANPVNVVQLDRARRDREEVNVLLRRPAAIGTVYQPIVELATGVIAGYEALSRFEGDEDTEETFAKAHRCGLGSFLEAKAIERALGAKERPRGTFISLNLSPAALLSREVQNALPADLDDVVIEVTEQELAPLADRVGEAVALVRRRGARLAIDDAGSGYAGLRHLMDYSPDMIKFDQSLVQGSHGDMYKGALVESLVRYARRIRAATCAEGVEDPDDLAFVTAAGVDYAQGYLLARPGEPWIATESLGAATGGQPRGDAGKEAVRSARGRLAAMLQGATRWEDVDAVLALVVVTVGADKAYLSRFVPNENYLVLISGHGAPTYDMPYPLSEYPASAEILESGRSLRVTVGDPDADPAETELLIEEGMATAFLHPVRRGDSSLGLLEIYSSRQRDWTADEQDYLRFVSDQLAGVLMRLKGTRASAGR